MPFLHWHLASRLPSGNGLIVKTTHSEVCTHLLPGYHSSSTALICCHFWLLTWDDAQSVFATEVRDQHYQYWSHLFCYFLPLLFLIFYSRTDTLLPDYTSMQMPMVSSWPGLCACVIMLQYAVQSWPWQTVSETAELFTVENLLHGLIAHLGSSEALQRHDRGVCPEAQQQLAGLDVASQCSSVESGLTQCVHSIHLEPEDEFRFSAANTCSENYLQQR